MCCVVKMNEGEGKKQGQYVTCTVQENMFSHETYGCTSWSSYIVAVISGFIFSSLPFVSQFYWIAPLLPLHPVCISAISLLLPRKFPHLISWSYSRQHTQAGSLTQFYQEEFVSCKKKSNSYPKLYNLTTASKKAFLVSFKKCLHDKH